MQKWPFLGGKSRSSIDFGIQTPCRTLFPEYYVYFVGFSVLINISSNNFSTLTVLVRTFKFNV